MSYPVGSQFIDPYGFPGSLPLLHVQVIAENKLIDWHLKHYAVNKTPLRTTLWRTAVPSSPAQLRNHVFILEILTFLLIRVQDEIIDSSVTFNLATSRDVRHDTADCVDRYVRSTHILNTKHLTLSSEYSIRQLATGFNNDGHKPWWPQTMTMTATNHDDQLG